MARWPQHSEVPLFSGVVSSCDDPLAGVVHMLGGGISLVLAIMVKNRPRRFIDANNDLAEEAKIEVREPTFFEVFQARMRALFS